MRFQAIRNALRARRLMTYLPEHEFDSASQRDVIAHLEQAVCFDAGSAADFVGQHQIPSLLRTPYPVTWVEFQAPTDPPAWVAALLIDQPEQDGILGLGFIQSPAIAPEPGIESVWWWRRAGDEVIRQVPARKDAVSEGRRAGVISLAGLFLTALNCKNVVQVEHRPPEKVQAKRRRNGKPPLFSYWTLELALPNTERVRQVRGDGEHASPRVHLRRGHPRQYAPGKYCWVQPCTVGNPRLGIVHKDYAVNTTKEPA